MINSLMHSLVQVGRYKHYKGNYYWVYGVVRHCDSQEWLVLYGANEPQWVRPLEEFKERVTFNGKNVARFQLLPDKVVAR